MRSWEESGDNGCTAPATTCFSDGFSSIWKNSDLSRTDRIGQSWAWQVLKDVVSLRAAPTRGKLPDCQFWRPWESNFVQLGILGRSGGPRTTVDGGVFALRFGGAGWAKKRRVTSFVADDGTFVSCCRYKAYRPYLANRQDNEKRKRNPLLLLQPYVMS